MDVLNLALAFVRGWFVGDGSLLAEIVREQLACAIDRRQGRRRVDDR